ncbi:Crp/Fnr family transcriptional regulator [Flavobacterium selenitireducens]|uniref:Crp/Fnr family transcriptional regulator n=1 Tax=Flavobacterium selenitireducens TaxID=2722704 RepID=UPI00168B1F8F|nr:Crp/Fnr family transcriptional regulator [Flavobacterium selenitireducens]MBD3581708.1 Crp/Fnr family transcriptional regulator [Flavobacterium selenitireducens]
MIEKQDFNQKLVVAIAAIGEQKTYGKGETILNAGETEQHVYFIESGAVRLSLLSDKDDQTIRLGYKGQMIVSLSSYLNQTPSEFSLESIRKTVLKRVTKAQLEQFIYQDADSAKGYIGLLEDMLTELMEREVDLLTASPVERMNRVLKRSPGLFREIPLKYIASYFRMTPETLSRIRNS